MTKRPSTMPTVSVVVLTRNRPRELAMCIEALGKLTVAPLEIIIVDDSEGDPNSQLRSDAPHLRWISGQPARHRINGLRTLGAQAASGDVVALLDDDSIARPEWLENLAVTYTDDDNICGVGGRIIESAARTVSPGRIGCFGPMMEPVGNFHLCPSEPCDVEHLRGCNFSFRRNWLQQVGWFHDGYRGWCLRDDTDICLTLRSHGGRLVFQPRAVVRHLAAPQQSFSRNTYSPRWAYVGGRWHSYFMLRHGRNCPSQLLRYLAVETVLEPLRILRQAAKRGLIWAAATIGRIVGIFAALWAAIRPPHRAASVGMTQYRHDETAAKAGRNTTAASSRPK